MIYGRAGSAVLKPLVIFVLNAIYPKKMLMKERMNKLINYFFIIFGLISALTVEILWLFFNYQILKVGLNLITKI